MNTRKRTLFFLTLFFCISLVGCDFTSSLPLSEQDSPASSSKLSLPQFSPWDGAVIPADGLDVILSSVEGATIYFTRDGSNPTISSERYFQAIHLTTTTTLKAYAVREGMIDSDIASATFTQTSSNEGTKVEPDLETEPEVVSGPTRLRITAKIDGRDELHISYNQALWKHHDYDYPSQVQINGRSWDPVAMPAWTLSSKDYFFRKNLDPGSAVLMKHRGRGQVRLGYDTDGFVIHFDDNIYGGADDYDVVISFAEILCQQSKSDITSTPMVDIKLTGRIDGTEEIQFGQNRIDWKHDEYEYPASVMVNGIEWKPKDVSYLMPPSDQPFFPDIADVMHATLTKVKARGSVRLDYYKDQLILSIQDTQPSDDDYDLSVHVPLLQNLKLVQLKSNLTDYLAGAPVSVLKYSADGNTFEIVRGQRVFGSQGQCQMALAAGIYQFEILHQPTAGVLVALKTDRITIDTDTMISLDSMSTTISPQLLGPMGNTMQIDEWGIRSILLQGQIVCAKSPILILSRDQSYAFHVLGHQNYTYVALWAKKLPTEMAKVLCAQIPLIQCNFNWAANTPNSMANGVTLYFPESQMEIGYPQSTTLYTNRQFFGLSYWLEFLGGNKAVFHPRSYSISSIPTSYTFTIGGPLTVKGTASILTDENLVPGNPYAKRLWWDVTLQDPQGHLLNKEKSDVDWQQEIILRNGQPIPPNPLSDAAVTQLGNLTDTLTLKASYYTRLPAFATIYPSAFVPHDTAHHRMTAPNYMEWEAQSYLAKMERSYQEILSVTSVTPDPSYQVEIKWWLNNGAVGGYGGVTMPFVELLDSHEWFAHPWAITHEMLHGFGYPHGWELNRIDYIIQDHFEDFRYYVADHPEYMP